MNKIFRHFAFAICFFTLAISTRAAAPDSLPPQKSGTKKVYEFEIRSEIGPAIWRQMQKAFNEADEQKADLIIIPMNTYGGMVIYADSMRTKILQSKRPVYVFVDNNAASAGALIAISCDSIFMRKGASIGAATVVDQTGQVMPDKYQSYMRSTMRATAEARGRDPEIAQAMVDPSIYVKGIIDTGKVLTFTTTEAMKYGFCEGTAESIEEVLKMNGIEKYTISRYEPTTMDSIISFLINPAFSGILIMIIIGGIYFELQTPGVGFPILASIIAALLYFAPLYLEGLAANWEIILFIVGLILIALEVFVIPGFGVAGIAGIACVVAGLTLSLIGNVGFDFEFTGSDEIVKALFTVMISLIVGTVVSVLLGRKLITSSLFQKLVLNTTQQSNEGYIGTDSSENELIGKTGIAYTMLRPAGKVEIDGEIYDATADRGYIEKGETVKVLKFETAQLFVRKIVE